MTSPLFTHVQQLLRPKHLHPRVRTATDYRQRQVEAMRAMRSQYPYLHAPDPWPSQATPAVYVDRGRILIRCQTTGCQNCPLVSPEWTLACCFACGAIYTQFSLPDTFAETERALMRRPLFETRNWLPYESVEDLRKENTAHASEGVR